MATTRLEKEWYRAYRAWGWEASLAWKNAKKQARTGRRPPANLRAKAKRLAALRPTLRDPKQLRMFGDAGHGQADLFQAVDTDVTVAYLDRGVRTIVRLPRSEARAFLRALPKGAWTSETRRVARALGLGRGAARDGGFDKKKLLRQIDKDQKLAARRKLADMRARIRELEARRRSGRGEVKAFCESGRTELRARILRLREELKQAISAERQAARESCSSRRRAPSLEIARLREDLRAERRHQASMRRIEAGNRKRRPSLAKASVRRSESDDEVRQNIPPELLGLFERVKRQIKGSRLKSRTEEFLEYAEENPGEEFAGIEDETERMIREHERALRSGTYRDPRPRRRGRRFRSTRRS